MRCTARLLALLALAAVAVPLVPFLAFGTRLDEMVARAIDPRPTPLVMAAMEVAVLAVDLLLPVPSSMVATLGGAELGVVTGTACAWLGLTISAVAGWWLGRRAGGLALERLDPAERAALQRHEQRIGPLLIVLTRPLPLLAEAASLFAGGAGMRLREFFPAAAGGNCAIALVWSFVGATGQSSEWLPLALAASLVIPVVLACLALRGPLTNNPTQLNRFQPEKWLR